MSNTAKHFSFSFFSQWINSFCFMQAYILFYFLSKYTDGSENKQKILFNRYHDKCKNNQWKVRSFLLCFNSWGEIRRFGFLNLQNNPFKLLHHSRIKPIIHTKKKRVQSNFDRIYLICFSNNALSCYLDVTFTLISIFKEMIEGFNEIDSVGGGINSWIILMKIKSTSIHFIYSLWKSWFYRIKMISTSTVVRLPKKEILEVIFPKAVTSKNSVNSFFGNLNIPRSRIKRHTRLALLQILWQQVISIMIPNWIL